MNLTRRIEKLERQAPAAPVDVGDLPPLVLHWPEDETAETRREQAHVKRLWREAGASLGDAAIVLNWGDGSEVLEP